MNYFNQRSIVALIIGLCIAVAIPCSAQNKAGAKKRAAPFSPEASSLTGKKADDLRVDMNEVVKSFDFQPFYRGAKRKGTTTTGNWQLQDDGNEVILRPRDGEESWRRFSAYLWSDRVYSDFVIDFEFQFEAGGNSGFYFRVADREDPVETGIEFQFNDTHAKGEEINHHDIGGLLRAHPAAVNAGKKAGEWNRAIVHVEGDRLRAYLNGFQIHDIDLSKTPLSDRPTKGFIGFQDHGLNLWLRNIRFSALTPNENEQAAYAPLKENVTDEQLRPNVLLILADDFGWGDTSSYSPKSPIKTPNIDRLAKDGIRLTNAHAPAAACTPTRYGLLTGRYPWRSYVKKRVLKFYAPAMITKDHVTIPSFLKSHNYRTAGFGKWHTGLDWEPLEGDPVNWRSHWNSDARDAAITVGKGIDHSRPFGNAPTDIGFDTYFGTPSNAGRMPFFIDDNRVFGNPQPDKTGLMSDPDLSRDTVDDIYVDKAIGFITEHQKNHQDRPFFVYLPLNAIHGAVQVPKRFEGKTGMSIREDKIPWVNESVGKMLDALDDLNLAEDTLVVFTSDNGPLNSPIARENGHQPTGPYRGVKSNIYEGGTRVPFLARWPGRIPAGVSSDQLVCLTDMLATVAELCGAPLRKKDHPDSVSLLPVLLQKNDAPVRDNLVTLSFGGFLTLQRDQWKAAFGTKWHGGFFSDKYGGKHPKDVPADSPELGQLFNISKDPFETSDVWEKHPEVVKTLREDLQRIRRLADDDPKDW